MFLTMSYDSTLHDTVDRINKTGVASYAHSFHPEQYYGTIVIFYFGDYPSYEWCCEKWGRKCQPPEKFYDGEL